MNDPSFDVYDPYAKPGKGWVWSKRLVKWRRPAVRQFMADRQGIHIVLGFVTANAAALIGTAVGLLAYAVSGNDWVGWLAGPVTGLAVNGMISHQFLRYEEVEAKEIGDDAYVDIGGYLGGQLGAVVELGVGGLAAAYILARG